MRGNSELPIQVTLLGVCCHKDGDHSSFSQMAPVVKNLLANAGDVRDADVIPGSGISPGGGNGIPLQYSCQENPMDRGA